MKNTHDDNDGDRVLQRAAVPESQNADGGPSDEEMSAINDLAPGTLEPDDVYVRSMYLCSDQVCPADWGRFTGNALREICSLVVGRAVLRGHDRSSLPLARFYRAEVVEREGETNSQTGEPVQWVRAWFYWLRGTTGARDLLLNIDGGVYREVSISWRYRMANCSLCGDDIRACDHVPGRTYDGARCHFIVDEVLDVLEGSLVYRGAESRASLAGARSTVGTVFTTNPLPSDKRPSEWTDFLVCLSRLPRALRRVVVSGEDVEREVRALKDLGLWVRVTEMSEANTDCLADPWEPSGTERVDLWVVKGSLPAGGEFPLPMGSGSSNVVPRADRILLHLDGCGVETSRAERRVTRRLHRMGYLTAFVRRDAGGLSVLAERARS